MVYHRSDSGGSSSVDAAPRRHSESSRGSGRDEEERPKSRDGKEDSKYTSDHSRSSSRYKDGRYSDSSRSRNGKDDGKYSDSSRYSKDSRCRDGREEGKYHERSREGREEGSRFRDGKDDGRYSESNSRHGDSSRYSESRYSEGSRYSSGGSRYGSGGGNGESWYSESSRHRDDSRYYSGGSSRYHGDDGSGEDETEDSSASTVKTEQEKLKNVFQNDGSFLEMFKKMQEAAKVNLETADSSASEPSTSEAEATVKQETVPQPAPAAVPRRPVAAGIVGKRRGGRVLPTGMVKKQKKEEEEVETPKDAWSMYMAEELLSVAMPSVAVMASKKLPTPEELSTAPFDPRFPNMNQTRYCWQSYVDYYRCQKLKGEGYEPCEYFRKCFQSLCPNAWVEKWDTQREENRFPGKI